MRRAGSTVEGARTFFHLPYFRAEMSAVTDGDAIEYRSRRTDRRGAPAELDVRYRPTGPVEPAVPGSLDAWLTDRMRLFAADGEGRILETEIRHAPWPLQPAEAEFRVETLAAAHGLTLPNSAAPPAVRATTRCPRLVAPAGLTALSRGAGAPGAAARPWSARP